MQSLYRYLLFPLILLVCLASAFAATGTRKLAVSPTAIDFGGHTVNTSTASTVTVSNIGTLQVNVQAVTVSGAAFSVSGFIASTTLAPGKSLALTVTFTPTAATTYTGQLTIQSNASNSPQNVSLSGSGTAAAVSVAVSVSPSTASVQTGATQQFSATVTGTTDATVTWQVNGVAGGNATVGTISSSGLYTAPTAVPSPATVTVAAQSVADTTKSGTASVTVTAPPAVAVTVSPSTASVQTGATQQFSATVTGTANTAVTWQVNGVAGGNATVGTISSSGLYTAPTAVPSPATVTVAAQSVADTTKSGTASVTVTAPAAPIVAVTVSPTAATVNVNQTQQFTATVTGASDTSVNWSVNGVVGGNTTVGSISASGLYTAPATVPAPATVTVTATSVADTTKSSSATVTIASGISVAVTPATASVALSATQQFSATVSGTADASVTWSVNGAAGGNSTVGTITSTGLYTAPATMPSNASVTVTATSVADTTKSGTASVTLTSVSSPTVSVSPASANVQTSATQQFTATVTGMANTAVTWSVNGTAGGNKIVGTISSTGLYTAPGKVPSPSTVTVTATSAADSTKSGSASVTITPATATVSVSVMPASPSVVISTTQQFTASVTGTTNTAVTWSVAGVAGGNATVGTIDATGLYTAPAAVPATATVTVTATLQADTTKSGSASATIILPPVAADYYVSPTGSDSNAGTSLAPWATIVHAAQVVNAGATVHVAPGSYSGQVTSSNNGIASARVRFISDQQWGAKIDAGNAQFGWYISGDYTDVIGFDITNVSYVGIGYKSNHVRIEGNRIHDLTAGRCTSSGGAAIDADSYNITDAQVVGNLIFNIGPGSGATRCNTVAGIYFATAGNLAANNLISTVSGDGISSWHYATNLTIMNNTIMTSLDAGIIIGGGSVTNTNTYVGNNIVAHNPNAGIAENGTTSATNQYVNNLMYANGYDWGLLNGVTATGTVTGDPQFVSYTGNASTGDYHLQASSPAIDAGAALNSPLLDYWGAVRPGGSAYDIGMCEYGATPGVWPWY